MSVIVKGMDMPTGCLSCPLFAGNGCKATRRLFPGYLNVAVRPDTCPLVNIPEKHGNLIDKSELLKCSVSVDDSWGCTDMVSVYDIDNAPTIIGAEV